MKNLNEKIANYVKLQLEIRYEALVEIKEAVTNNNGKIELDSSDDNEYLALPNNSSFKFIVHSVENENGTVSVFLGNTSIPLDYLLADEVIDLYDTLFNYTLPRIEAEKKENK